MERAARIALALYLLAGASITLGPTPDRLFGRGQRAVGEVTDGALSGMTVEAAANIALFVPLAFLLCQSFPTVRRRLLWALCVTASAGIEAYQYLFPGRDATVRDLAMNSLGAALGVVLSRALDAVLDSRRARRSDRTPRG